MSVFKDPVTTRWSANEQAAKILTHMLRWAESWSSAAADGTALRFTCSLTPLIIASFLLVKEADDVICGIMTNGTGKSGLVWRERSRNN